MNDHDENSVGKFAHSISLVCWAYNEEELIAEYLEKATKLLDENINDYEIILIDDASTDKTNEIAADFQKINPKLKIFRNEINLNVGISSRRAIQKASKEYLFWQTIDWSYDIANLRKFLTYLDKYDIVQGVRVRPVKVRIKFLKPFVVLLKLLGMKHLTRRSDTVKKAIVSVINFLLIRLLFRVPFSDFQNITFYPTKWIQSINFEAKSSFVSPEGLMKSYWHGMRIKEVPIDFIPRKKGEGKGTRIKFICTSVIDIISLWFRWIILRKLEHKGKGQIDRIIPSEWD